LPAGIDRGIHVTRTPAPDVPYPSLLVRARRSFAARDADACAAKAARAARISSCRRRTARSMHLFVREQ